MSCKEKKKVKSQAQSRWDQSKQFDITEARDKHFMIKQSETGNKELGQKNGFEIDENSTYTNSS